MALHELVTNAGKYGALANSSGHIQITWDMNEVEFSLSWSEVDGPPVATPTGKGFGTTVLTTLVEMSLGGATEIDYNPKVSLGGCGVRLQTWWRERFKRSVNGAAGSPREGWPKGPVTTAAD